MKIESKTVHEPIHGWGGVDFREGDFDGWSETFLEVPEGAEITVLQVSAKTVLPGNQGVHELSIHGIGESSHWLALQPPTQVGNQSIQIGTWPVRLFLRAGENLHIRAKRNSSEGLGNVYVHVSGYATQA